MKFSMQRDALLKPLQIVSGVVEKRQTLPILSNVLIKVGEHDLSITATDLEVEIKAKTHIDTVAPGDITVPARKIVDICRTLADDAVLHFEVAQEKAMLRSAKTRFTLTTLPAADFPSLETDQQRLEFTLSQAALKRLIEKTCFAMAQQDVRYYLNGMLLELDGQNVRAVATDGHRLALCVETVDIKVNEKVQAIIPRKGVMELARLLEDSDTPVRLGIGTNHIRAELDGITFTSKLIDGRFPDYERVLPKDGNKKVVARRDELKQCLVRASILSNEKYRGIRLYLVEGVLRAMAQNPEQEEAEDEIEVQYSGEALEMGFNVSYLLDAIGAIKADNVSITVSDANSSGVIRPEGSDDCLYVVMPMRL